MPKTKSENIDNIANMDHYIDDFKEILNELRTLASDNMREKTLVQLKMHTVKNILSRKNMSPNKKVSFLKSLLDFAE